MHLLTPPMTMIGHPIELPDILVCSHKEVDKIPAGVPYVVWNHSDEALLLRLLIPILEKKYPAFDWKAIYIEQMPGIEYENKSVDMLAQSLKFDCYVDLDTIMELRFMPKFCYDLREAVKVNVTNNYAWTDGYNKKTGVCSGYLTEMPAKKNLLIVDVSSSIPDGVVSGMMTLVQTMTHITHSDVIITGGKSYFYPHHEALAMDPVKELRRIPRDNEISMITKIFKEIDMSYENVISFGDSDGYRTWSASNYTPGGVRTKVRNLYNMYVGEHDRYGRHYSGLGGYISWIPYSNAFRPNIIHNYDWVRYFNRNMIGTSHVR